MRLLVLRRFGEAPNNRSNPLGKRTVFRQARPMSERPTDPIRPAATILLLRDAQTDASPFEVLMVKRHHQIDFAAGALVFPGGKSHAGDHDPAWSDHATGWESVGEDAAALRIAAIREAYEEAGVLLARDAAGETYVGEAAIDVRAAVAEDRMAFLDVVRDLGLKLDLAALTIFARWITPPLMAKRFDTWFYVAHAPPGAAGDLRRPRGGRRRVDRPGRGPGPGGLGRAQAHLSNADEPATAGGERQPDRGDPDGAVPAAGHRRAMGRRPVTADPAGRRVRRGGGAAVGAVRLGAGALKEDALTATSRSPNRWNRSGDTMTGPWES